MKTTSTTALYYCSPTQQHDNRVSLCWYKPQFKHVPTATVVTLQYSLTERPILMKSYFMASCTNKMIHNMAMIEKKNYTLQICNTAFSCKKIPENTCSVQTDGLNTVS